LIAYSATTFQTSKDSSYRSRALRELIRPKLNVGCRWCFTKITPQNMSIDHMLPICRGGLYTIENCGVICMDCNMRKSIMNDEEYEILRDALLLMPVNVASHVYRRLKAGARVVKRG
jgi:5-methylcytosine-specific restriction endonuclease McrA